MSWTEERAKVAALSRSRTADDPDLVQARERLRVARFEEHVRKLVESAPPLSDGQRSRLAVLIHGSAPARDAAA